MLASGALMLSCGTCWGNCTCQYNMLLYTHGCGCVWRLYTLLWQRRPHMQCLWDHTQHGTTHSTQGNAGGQGQGLLPVSRCSTTEPSDVGYCNFCFQVTSFVFLLHCTFQPIRLRNIQIMTLYFVPFLNCDFSVLHYKLVAIAILLRQTQLISVSIFSEAFCIQLVFRKLYERKEQKQRLQKASEL